MELRMIFLLIFLGGEVTLKKLREYDLTIVAGVLKLYFLELPECLFTFELYEPVKLLYSISKLINYLFDKY